MFYLLIINIKNLEPQYIEANGLMMNITHNSGKDRPEEQVSNSSKQWYNNREVWFIPVFCILAFNLFTISAMLLESGCAFSKANYINAA